MSESMKRRIRESGITARMMILFIGFVILPFIALSVFVFVYFYNYSIRSTNENMMDSTNSVGMQISTLLREKENDSMFLYYSGAVELLSKTDALSKAEENQLESTISAQVNAGTDIRQIQVVSFLHGTYGGQSAGAAVRYLEDQEEEILGKGGRCCWYGTNQLSGRVTESKYILARALNNAEGEAIGILYIVYNGKMISDIFSQIINEISVRYLTDEKGRILYCSEPEQVGDLLDITFTDTGKIIEDLIQKKEGKRFLFINRKIFVNGWNCVSTVKMSNIYINLRKLTLPFVLISLIYIVFLVAVLWVFRRYVFLPLQILKRSMDTYATEGLAPSDVNMGGSGEFRSLSRHFNNMTLRIDHLMRQYQKEAEEKNRQQVRTMTAQLTPHFMYNALNTIRWMAVLNKQDNIQNLVESLIYILKNAVKIDDSEYTLEDELTLIRNYAVIQKARFMNFELLIEVPEECLRLKMKKMLVQPVVENAILHGLGRGKIKNTGILVKAWRDSDLHIVVRDEGVGFDVEKWRADRQPGKEHTNIGIVNVESIIRMEYGEGYGLTIESAIGKGTTVTYLLPAEEGEQKI